MKYTRRITIPKQGLTEAEALAQFFQHFDSIQKPRPTDYRLTQVPIKNVGSCWRMEHNGEQL